MLELIDALPRVGFAVFIVSGGTEFVGEISHDLHEVTPERSLAR